MYEHNTGKRKNSYTYKLRSIELKFYAEFTDIDLAIETEKRIKKRSKVK